MELLHLRRDAVETDAKKVDVPAFLVRQYAGDEVQKWD